MVGTSRALELMRWPWGRRPHALEAPSSVGPRPDLVELSSAAKGFLDVEEGRALFRLAHEASRLGPCIEIGSYCGKSALFLGEACRLAGRHPLFTIDHHAGSPEQQPGEKYFDPELYDRTAKRPTTLQLLVQTVATAGLSDWILPIVGNSHVVGRSWARRSAGLVFIDGCHSAEAVVTDCAVWGERVRSGGYLCLHDVYEDPADGGQAPYDAFQHLRTLASWEFCAQVESLGVLRRR